MSALLYGCLSVYLDVSLSVLMSECVFFGISDHLDVSFSLYLYVYLDVRVAIRISVSGFLDVLLSVGLPIWMYVYPDVLVYGCVDVPLIVLMFGSVDDRMSLHLSVFLSVQILGSLDICLS